MKKNVLVESTKSKFQVLTHKPANVLKRIKGVLSDFGSNRNGRIYPRELWENVINSDYVKEMINSHGLVGELDHPEERLEISLQEVSHVINDMWIEGDQVLGIIDILPTPNGKIVNELLDYGTDIGISSRGAGSVGAGNIVDPDYQFITFDFVARPSCEAARLNTILEGVKVDLENNSDDKVNTILESYKEELKEADDGLGYVRYVDNWLKDHGHKDQFDIEFGRRLKGLRGQDLLNAYKKIFDELYDDNGYSGELFVSYNEYLDNEQTQYLDEETDNYKERFMTYCEGKIKDLGTTRVEYYDRKVDVKIAFIQDIRNFGTCKVLDPTDCFELLDVEDAFCFLKPDGTFTATPMTSADIVLARLEFDEIDQVFYDDTLKHWDDLDMDGTMMDQLSESAKSNIKVTKETYKLDPSYKLNEAMTDQEVYKIVLNWYKDQIEAGKMTLNQCYELLSDKAKVSLNKLVDQNKIRESVVSGAIKELLKEAKEETIKYSPEDEKKLEEIYDNLQAGIAYGEDMTKEGHSWVKYPYFDTVLHLIANSPHTTEEVIGWRHYGSSANKNTKEDLKWVLDNIFKMTPTEFLQKYIKNTDSKLDEAVKPERKWLKDKDTYERFKHYVDKQLRDGAIDDPEYVKTLSDEEYESLLVDTWMKDDYLQDAFEEFVLGLKEAYGEPPSDRKYHPILNKDLEISSPLELNTGVIPVLDVGTYGREDYIFRWDDEETPEDAEPDWDELDSNIITYGTPIVEEYIKEVLPSASVKGTKVFHPKYYNFQTDELEFKVSFDIGEYNDLESKTFKDPEFGNFLKENYKSYDGFISYLADNLDEFYQQDGWKRFCQVIMFYLRDRSEDIESSTESFWETIVGNGLYIKEK
jgi:hypothetical protein